MEIILIQDVDNIGAAHEKVSVKNGYARNFLIPRKLAVEANPSNLKQLDERLKQQKKKEEKLLAEVNKVIEVLKSSPLKIGAKTGTSGKIFGSVTSVQIGRAIRDQKCRHLSCIFVAQLEVRHGRGGSVSLRIFEPCKNPFSRCLVGDMGQRRRIIRRLQCRSVLQLHHVTMHTALAHEQIAPLIQLRRAR